MPLKGECEALEDERLSVINSRYSIIYSVFDFVLLLQVSVESQITEVRSYNHRISQLAFNS
jgi:hypothetical protein